MSTTSPLQLSAPAPTSLDDEWRELYQFVFPVLTRRLRLQPEDIEDMAQDVLFALARHAGASRSPGHSRGLAVKIASDRVTDWLRARCRAGACRQRPWSDELAETLSAPDGDGFERDLAEAVSLMADDVREVFQAVSVQGLSRRATAESLGLTLHEVRVLFAEAKRFISVEWGMEEG